MKVNEQKRVEILLKMEKFYNYKCKAYPYKRLNTCKGVIRSRELSLATEEEIKVTLYISRALLNTRESILERMVKQS